MEQSLLKLTFKRLWCTVIFENNTSVLNPFLNFFSELDAEKELQLQLSSDTDDFITDIEDEDQRYERVMRAKKHRLDKQMQHDVGNVKPNFENTLITFGQLDRLPADTKILSYWKENSNVFEPLLRVSRSVFAVPGTQVSVERLFSQLKFILSDLRTCLSSNNVNNILLVRTNFDLIDCDFFDKY